MKDPAENRSAVLKILAAGAERISEMHSKNAPGERLLSIRKSVIECFLMLCEASRCLASLP